MALPGTSIIASAEAGPSRPSSSRSSTPSRKGKERALETKIDTDDEDDASNASDEDDQSIVGESSIAGEADGRVLELSPRGDLARSSSNEASRTRSKTHRDGSSKLLEAADDATSLTKSSYAGSMRSMHTKESMPVGKREVSDDGDQGENESDSEDDEDEDEEDDDVEDEEP